MTGRNGSSTYSVPANQATYLGSIFVDGSAGQVSCHLSYGQSRKWGVWNAYNQRPICLKGGDGTATWTYNGTNARAARNDTNNKLTVFCGLQQMPIYCTNADFCDVATLGEADNAIGFNSSTVVSGRAGVFTNASAVTLSATLVSEAIQNTPLLGIMNVFALEQTNGATITFYGTERFFCLTAKWLG
jgi:hypothetical protein